MKIDQVVVGAVYKGKSGGPTSEDNVVELLELYEDKDGTQMAVTKNVKTGTKRKIKKRNLQTTYELVSMPTAVFSEIEELPLLKQAQMLVDELMMVLQTATKQAPSSDMRVSTRVVSKKRKSEA